jgi:hypothetical protein
MEEIGARRRPAPAFALALASVWLAAAPAAAEWVDWIAQAELGFEFDDNVNRSAFDHDEESDFVWRPAASVGRVYQVGDLTRVALSVDAEGAIYHEREGLNAVQLGGTAALIHKFGLGEVPELRVYGSAGYLNLRDDERDGMLYEAGAELSRAFGERLEGTLFGLYSWRDGNEGVRVLANEGRDVWDQRAFEIGARGSFLLTEQLQLGAGYSYRDGDFDSACTKGNVAKVIAREGSNLKAIARDDVFGGCVYRLGGHLHTASLSLNYGIGRRFSVDLGYRFLYGQARELIYRSNVVGVAVLFRY